MKFIFLSLVVGALIFSCTKKIAVNPSLAYGDKALLDSCRNQQHPYYKNDAATLRSGSAGPHGTFKLRFNKAALAALTEGGKLPLNAKMPEGSLIIKDVYDGSNLKLYAFMYKKSGSWLWGEIKPDGNILYSVNRDASLCINCHNQPGNRDQVVSFNFY
jgi:hypothetical protein